MTAIDKTPSNKNFLSPLGYQFYVKKLPNVNFFTQHVVLPTVTLPDAHQPTPFVAIHQPGDHLQFSDLSINFKVDEDMKNYSEIYNWMSGLGFPDDYSQYKDISSKNQHVGDGLFSDISLIILTNLKNANIEFIFRDAWPTYLGNFNMSTTDSSVNFVNVDASFKFTSFKVNAIAK